MPILAADPSFTALFTASLNTLLRRAQPFVCLRRPHRSSFSLLFLEPIAEGTAPAGIKAQGTEKEEDLQFLLAPFDRCRPLQKFKVTEELSGSAAHLASLLYLQDLCGDEAAEDAPAEPPADLKRRCESLNAQVRACYESDFSRFKEALCAGRFSKLVLSRPHYQIPRRPLSTVFLDLCDLQPEACCLLMHTGSEVLLYASPELLAECSDGAIKTMALAGTQRRSAQDAYSWGAKDQREQQLVTDFIVSTLEPLSAQPVHLTGPCSRPAGAAVHLCTDITAVLKPEVTAEEILSALHPTPAVCGLPQQEAREFIEREESGSRGFYAGFTALLRGGRGAAYVNLRGLSFKDGIACLRAGGGILPESELQSEWQETELKLQVLKELL